AEVGAVVVVEPERAIGQHARHHLRAPVAQVLTSGRAVPADPAGGDERADNVVADLDPGHARAHGLDHAGPLVPADHGQPPGRVARLQVSVGVAHPRRPERDPDFPRPGFVQLKLGDLPRLARFPDYRCPSTHASRTTPVPRRKQPAQPNRLPGLACGLTTNPRASRTLSLMAVKTPETHIALVRRARKINRVLAETYPDAHTELDFKNPFQLLVATVLSAQTTDKRVNLTTPALFAKYPTPEDLAAANPDDVAEILRPTGFFNAKTKSVMGLSAALVERFGGEVPRTVEQMVTLPGVGRKTANVVLGNAYGIPGITVDTHFGRLSRRFGWTTSDDPVKVEADVGELIPKKDWVMLSHRLIWHGRRICHARKPACGVCPVADWCPSFGLGPTDVATAAKLVKAGPFS